MLPENIHTLNITLTTALLLYAFIQDLTTRQIHNATWIIAASLLIPLHLSYIIQTNTSILPTLAWGTTLTMTSILLWLTRTWGGADAKGTIILAWSLPTITIGPITTHPLLYAIPVSLTLVLLWMKIRPGPVPYYAIHTPILTTLILLDVTL